MKRKTDNEELLDDVLSEAAPPDFRAALLGKSVRVVRRRQRLRQARNAVAALVVVGLFVYFVWPTKPLSVAVTPPPVIQPLPKPVQTPAPVPSVPAPPAPPTPQPNFLIVDTQPLSADSLIKTQPFAPVTIVDSSTTIAVIQTTTGNYQIIGDDELLALIAAHPALLIHVGPDTEKLIFANPDDAKGFPAN
jgi:hypothetical protein